MGEEGEIWRTVKKENDKVKEQNFELYYPILEQAYHAGIGRQVEYYHFIIGEYNFYPLTRKWWNQKRNLRGYWRNETALRRLIAKAQQVYGQ